MTVLTKREVWKRPRALTTGRTPDLTADEIKNVKAALRVLRRRYETWQGAAEALGVRAVTLRMAVLAKRRPSVALALRVARLVGVAVEDVLSGAWPKAGACPCCGRTD
jgi:DNA-binding XRE family transcriptional regulator